MIDVKIIGIGGHSRSLASNFHGHKINIVGYFDDKGSKEEVIDKGLYSKFYMHRIGHWLGMDVHDVGSYKQDGDWRALEKGMVMTVEPGIYILNSLEDVDDKWKGIGVRIEDDILITDTGFEVLTPNVPRTIDEVEQAVKG